MWVFGGKGHSVYVRLRVCAQSHHAHHIRITAHFIHTLLAQEIRGIRGSKMGERGADLLATYIHTNNNTNQLTHTHT